MTYRLFERRACLYSSPFMSVYVSQTMFQLPRPHPLIFCVIRSENLYLSLNIVPEFFIFMISLLFTPTNPAALLTVIKLPISLNPSLFIFSYMCTAPWFGNVWKAVASASLGELRSLVEANSLLLFEGLASVKSDYIVSSAAQLHQVQLPSGLYQGTEIQ